MIYNLLADRWQISTDMDVNYMLLAERPALAEMPTVAESKP